MPNVTLTPYGGWKNCYTLSNGIIEAVVTADVGPRVIRFGFPNGANIFNEDPEFLGKTDSTIWVNYGGHRLWHSPEDRVRTYSPDNSPVAVETFADGAVFTQAIEPETGIVKQIELRISDGSPHIRVTHRLTNKGQWGVTFAPWALSVMNVGGTAIVPLPPRGSHESELLPKSTIALWAYTNMADPRWTWGNKYVMLRQQANGAPQKIGASVPEGWAAYAREDALFIKFFDYNANATYPDYGSNCEIFTNSVMLEVESLGATQTIAPGATIEHVEDWLLYPGITAPKKDIDVENTVMPRVNEAKALTGR